MRSAYGWDGGVSRAGMEDQRLPQASADPGGRLRNSQGDAVNLPKLQLPYNN